MKTLKNKMLNKIYTRFMEKKRDYKTNTTIFGKILTYIPILNSFKLINDSEAFLILFLGYILSSSLTFIPFHEYFFEHDISMSIDDLFAVLVLCLPMIIFYVLSLISSFTNTRIEKEKHEQEYKSKPLSVEDLNTVIDSVNKKIVSKLLKDNDQKITYGDLEKLDELLLKEKEILAKIEHEKMSEILGKIDINVLIEKFKDKDINEIVDSLKKSGLNFKDAELLVKRDILTSKIVKSEK